MSTEVRFESDPSGEVNRLPAASGLCGDCQLAGTGSPNGSVEGGFEGQTYFDTAANTLYVFEGTPGSTTGWSAVSGGSGANFLSGNGSPEGVVEGQVEGQTYLDLDTGGLWVFGGTPGTDTGWL